MGENTSPPTLQELVSAFERSGRAALADYRDAPAIAHCDGSAKPNAAGFETQTIVARWDVRVALALARDGRQINPELLSTAGAVYPLKKRSGGPFPERIGVGRARTADISIRLPSVSKYHAFFTHDEKTGGWTLWDARSRNGTWVAQQRVAPDEGAPVQNGTNIAFGESVFLFFTYDGVVRLMETLATKK